MAWIYAEAEELVLRTLFKSLLKPAICFLYGGKQWIRVTGLGRFQLKVQP